jgi:hypothetical protein
MRSLIALLIVAGGVSAWAQVAGPPPPPVQKPTLADIGLFIYPAKNQTPDQQGKDEAACYSWAETQTGLVLQAGSVDTTAAAKAGSQAGSQKAKGAVVGGAAVGAGAGAAIGAIAGSAGKGAAIGAIAGTMGGLGARKKAKDQGAKAGAEQATKANKEKVDSFKKAAAACLEGRGYTVK